MNKNILCILLASSFATSALASDNKYVGALYSKQEMSYNDKSLNTVGLVGGYQFNNYISLEGRFSMGTSGLSEVYETPDSPGTVKIEYKEDFDNQAAVLIKASYPVSQSLNFYALAGYAKTKLEVTLKYTVDSPDLNQGISTSKRSFSDGGFSYGVGFNYQLNEQFSLFVDYNVLPDFDVIAHNSKRNWENISLGINYHF